MNRRRMKARPGELRVTYNRVERGENLDVVFSRGEGVARPDGHLMHFYFSQESKPHIQRLELELESRGYDLSTMVFSIMKKKNDIPNT